MMWKCEKGKKQYKVCKEANADYCSDCPPWNKRKYRRRYKNIRRND